jgi:RecG-like helicase
VRRTPALAALAAPASAIRAVGPKRSGELARFGLKTVEDVLYHLPFRYEDRRVVTPMRLLEVGIDAGRWARSRAFVRAGSAGRGGRSSRSS